MKKTYMKPETKVVLMKARPTLLAGSGVVSGTSVKMSWDDDADDNEEGL